jgi:8-oxo-dGTP pyrophosphatase MutT (NUDIX family)
MTTSPRHSVSVAAAVIRGDNRVLCIRRRDNGHWEPPGGILERGERIHHGVVREVQEETGLTVNPETLTGIYQNEPRDILALVFRCTVEGGALRTSDETAEVAWLDRQDLQARMTESYAVRLTDALDFDGNAAIRTHDGKYLTA